MYLENRMTFHKGKYTYAEIMDSHRIQIHISCRCNVKDVAVEVPVPDNTIPDFIIPSHIVVPRCTGVFLSCSNLIDLSYRSSQMYRYVPFPFQSHRTTGRQLRPLFSVL